MSLKKIILLFISCLFMMSLISCGTAYEQKTPEKKPSKKTSISIWSWDEHFNVVACDEAKKIYEGINPDVNIIVKTVAQEDIVQKLHTCFSSGSYDELPEIFLMEDYKIQNFLNKYPGNIKDLTAIVDQSRFMDYKLNVLRKDNKIYGVPFDSGVAALFYRTDYLAKAGFSKEDMTNITWEEYIEIGKKVKQTTGKYMLSLRPDDLAQIRIMMQSAGEWYVKEDGSTINIYENQSLRDAISLYMQMLESGIAMPISDWNSFLLSFQTGEVASIPIGCWVASSIMVSTDQYNKWAIVPIPRIGSNKNSINTSNVGGSDWFVVSKKENADIAADFLAKTFASSDELMNNLVKDINLVSTLKSASACENYNMKSGFFGGQEIFKEFAQWTEKIPAVNYGLYTNSIDPIISDALEKIADGGDIDEQLLIAQKRAEAIGYQ